MPFSLARSSSRLATCFVFALSAALHAADAEWKTVDRSTELTVYERPRRGSSLKEYRAVGMIAALPATVKRVLEDVDEYPKFMPYVAEAKLIWAERNTRLTYQRLSPPFVGDRDYTIRITSETRRSASGLLSFLNRWECANDRGPKEIKGVKRVAIVEGSWLLEPVKGGATRATYSVFSDAGGALPPMIANLAGKAAIPRVFAAIRKQVQRAKYLAPR